jgi:hypothetical protein
MSLEEAFRFEDVVVLEKHRTAWLMSFGVLHPTLEVAVVQITLLAVRKCFSSTIWQEGINIREKHVLKKEGNFYWEQPHAGPHPSFSKPP